MTRATLLAVPLSFVLAACGPAEEDESPFLGRWYGTASASVEGGQPLTYNAYFDVSLGAQSDSFFVSGVCRDGSGTMPVRLSDGEVQWSGTLTCPWPPGPACSTSVLTYKAMRGVVTANGTLAVTVEGSLEGCGLGPYFVGVSFYGRK